MNRATQDPAIRVYQLPTVRTDEPREPGTGRYAVFSLLEQPSPFTLHPLIHLAYDLRVSSGRSLQNRDSAESGWLVTNDLAPVKLRAFYL